MLCGAEVDLIGSSGGSELEGWKRENLGGVRGYFSAGGFEKGVKVGVFEGRLWVERPFLG
jgi:hypothetical protein